jgi:hypothetical protein
VGAWVDKLGWGGGGEITAGYVSCAAIGAVCLRPFGAVRWRPFGAAPGARGSC